MLKPEIIIADVNTLNEARYFAATGAAWMSFDADLNAETLKSIVEWVVGPRFFMNMKPDGEERFFELSSRIQLDGVCLPQGMTAPDWYHGVIIREMHLPVQSAEIVGNEIRLFRSRRFSDEDISSLNDNGILNPYWIEIQETRMLRALLSEISPDGLVLNCNQYRSSGELDYALCDTIIDTVESLRRSSAG